jgi:hypothetical protein
MPRRRFEAKLAKSYPALFSRAYLTDAEIASSMITCGEGWFLLIKMLCEQVQDLVDDTNLPQPTIFSIKEKFGVMRVQHQGSPDAVRELISAAERASGCFCEVCGRLGDTQRTQRGWIKTLCARCIATASSDV